MRINTGWDRWLHLLILCCWTALGFSALMHFFPDWQPLSALSLSCVAVVQINNVWLYLREEGRVPMAAIKEDTKAVQRKGKKGKRN